MITGRTALYALVGHPVRESLSPAMHNELFRRKRVDAVYVALDVRPADAPRLVDALRTLRVAGVNLTVPFKERVLGDLDALGPEASAAGVVNVVVRDGERLVGHSTDGRGYLEALEVEMGVRARGRRAVLLGAGGTGRAVAAALAAAGAEGIVLLNRTVARAEAALASLAPLHPACAFEAGPLDRATFARHAPGAELVVNCVSGEGAAAVASLEVHGLRPGAVWTDANYWMSDPPQLVTCAGRGVRVQRGIGMLIHQGAWSFRLFTGVEVDAEEVRGVLDVGGW